MAQISFIDKLRKDNPDLYKEFTEYVRYHTYGETAVKYAVPFNMEPKVLLARLPVWGSKYGYKKPVVQPLVKATDKPLSPNGLNEEELKFLDKFKSGDISFEHVQREFAYRVLKKVLENPELLKVADWLRSEVIKIQREELSMKKENMERSWAMLFSGFLIPKFCPKCGHDLQPKVSMPVDHNPLKIVDAETVNDKESVGVAVPVSQP